MAKFLGVDTGGTFTDFILFDSETRAVSTHKVLSTPASPESSILQGLQDMGIDSVGLTMVHGSTVATNAILEGKGVDTAYITNSGMADVLRIGRQAREQLYNLTPIKKPLLVEASHCLEIDSRLSAQGKHLRQADEGDMDTLLRKLETLAPEAVAINLLFSFFDDSEERKIEQAIARHFDKVNLFISRSSDVLPEYKEFERGMATVLNAKVGPLMQGYLQRLHQQLKGSSLSIMQSSGGTTSAEQAGRYPVKLLLSGPAGGLKGAQLVAAASDEQRLLSFDMGGTSTDVSIIDKRIGLTNEGRIGGYPIAVPMIDMHTIGAGGGSIAQVDAGGLLLVGPESAGAAPGPACYANGGARATVTDANVVLGRLQPQCFLGGGMKLDKTAAHTAVTNIADGLSTGNTSMCVEQAAQGIIDVVNDHMVRALRVMSVERGEDPKEFTLVSFGGAGGLHVCALAEQLEMSKALVPVNAGVLSALGMLAAKASRERSRTINRCLPDCEAIEVNQIFKKLTTHAIKELTGSAGFPVRSEMDVRQSIDVRYQGQSHTLNLPWKGLADIASAFHEKHEDSYGHQLDMEIELVNLRVRVIKKQQSFELPEWSPCEKLNRQMITLYGVDKPVTLLNRMGLTVNQQITGPALITETSSTTWLSEGWVAKVDAVGNLTLVNQ